MKNIILIPEWVTKALATRGYSNPDVLDQDKLCSVLSDDDVGFYMLANQEAEIFKQLSPLSLHNGIGALGLDGEKLSELKSHLEGHMAKYHIGKIEPRELLFSSFSASDSNGSTMIGFDIVELTPDTIGLIPTQVEEFNILKIRRKLIDMLSKYHDFKVLASMPEFKGYLEAY